MTPSPEVARLLHQIRAMPPSDRLRLAADLLDARRPEMAFAVVRMVHDALAVYVADAAVEKARGTKP